MLYSYCSANDERASERRKRATIMPILRSVYDAINAEYDPQWEQAYRERRVKDGHRIVREQARKLREAGYDNTPPIDDRSK